MVLARRCKFIDDEAQDGSRSEDDDSEETDPNNFSEMTVKVPLSFIHSSNSFLIILFFVCSYLAIGRNLRVS